MLTPLLAREVMVMYLSELMYHMVRFKSVLLIFTRDGIGVQATIIEIV